ncbi:Putative E3 ubiquitin-protein ligase RING1a [Zea mays]|uniref:Putative E3 ubiquitin-protein ligase RING1a n=1 Tax=Zea mays TaxID=4577 RepID=A0A1D6EP08_MAIZE|nr:Putative E3 ubiquitin-protein ligase RING1a [Zea mays]
MNEVDEESKQVSYPVIRDDNGNDKLDFPALGKQFAAEEISAQLNLYLVLLPLDGQSVPKLEKPYHSCLPTLSIRHLCQAHAILLDPCALVLEYLQRDIICFLHILEVPNGVGKDFVINNDEVIPSRLCPSQRKDVKPHSYHATN